MARTRNPRAAPAPQKRRDGKSGSISRESRTKKLYDLNRALQPFPSKTSAKSATVQSTHKEGWLSEGIGSSLHTQSAWGNTSEQRKSYYTQPDTNRTGKEKQNMPAAFIIGTAGSGKSLFTAALSEWLKMSKQDVAVVNLDPGALKLPYSPDVDVRNYVDVGDLMEKYC